MDNNIINCRGRLVDIASKPIIMGILNVTPDSFYDGGVNTVSQSALHTRIHQIMCQGGALPDRPTIIDVGAYSTRPGAAEVSADEEWARLKPVLAEIRQLYPMAIVSVDTFRASVAKLSVEEGGADIINDVSCGNLDPLMFQTVGELGCPYILTHMRGTPQTMQQLTQYNNVTNDVIAELSQKITLLRQNKVKDIIIDPGFGFAKTLEQNYTLMRELKRFEVFNMPLLVGISNKSMIYKLIGGTPQTALNGTTALNMFSLMNGANILRVHNVKECAECIQIYENLMGK